LSNPDHVAVAKGGTYSIARWRERHFRRRERLDLSGAYLSGARLPSVDLAYDDLSGADLTSADLRRSNLVGANLRSAHLSRAQMAWSQLQRANMQGISLGRADLTGSDEGVEACSRTTINDPFTFGQWALRKGIADPGK